MGLSFAAPHAGRDHAVALGEQVVIISIHAPLAGRDPEPRFGYKNDRISIHAPLAGCDSKFDEFLSANLRKSNKNGLAERGENAVWLAADGLCVAFSLAF